MGHYRLARVEWLANCLQQRDRRGSRFVVNREQYLEDVISKRDFVAAYLYNLKNSLDRIKTGDDVWMNCLEFIFLLFYRIGILTDYDFKLIMEKYPPYFYRRLFRYTKQLKRPFNHAQAGDLAIWYTDTGMTDFEHIGLMVEVGSTPEVSKIINLDKFDEENLDHRVKSEDFKTVSTRHGEVGANIYKNLIFITPISFITALMQTTIEEERSIELPPTLEYYITIGKIVPCDFEYAPPFLQDDREREVLRELIRCTQCGAFNRTIIISNRVMCNRCRWRIGFV